MNLPNSGDLTLLGFVREEIDRTLASVADKLSGDPQPEVATSLADELHRVMGAFGVAGLEGLVRYADALEKVASIFKVEDLTARRDPVVVFAVLRRGVNALQSYLHGLANGRRNRPLLLLSEYGQLRMLLGDDRVPASDLFWPDTNLARPHDSLPVGEIPDDAEVGARTARARYQRGMLAWLRGDNRGLRYMREAMNAMDLLYCKSTSLFWIAGGFVDSLASGGVEPDSLVKKLCARLDIQLARMGDGSSSVANTLLRDMLYHVATSRSETADIARLREHFALARYMLESTEGAAIHNVAVTQLRTAWEQCVGAPVPNLATLDEPLSKLRESSEPFERDVAKALDAVRERLATASSPGIPSDIGLAVAKLLLLADPSADVEGTPTLRDSGTITWALNNVRAALAGESTGHMPTSTSDNIAQHLSTVIAPLCNEVGASIKRIEHALTTYSAQPKQANEAETAVKLLGQLVAMLDVAQLESAARVLGCCRDTVNGWINASGSTVNEGLATVAEALATVEAYMLSLRSGQPDAAAVLDPIMGKLGIERPQPPMLKTAEPPMVPSVEEALVEGQREAQSIFNELNDQYSSTLMKLERNLRSVHEDSRLTSNRDAEHASAAALAVVQKLRADATSDLAPLINALSKDPEPENVSPPALFDVGSDPEILEVFLEEAIEVLQAVADSISTLRGNAHSLEAFVVIRRSFHTLKGSSRMAGLSHMGDVAWRFEEMLNQWLAEARTPDSALMELIDTARTRFAAWIHTLKDSPSVAIQADDLLQSVAKLRGFDVAASPAAQSAPSATAVPTSAAPPAAEKSVPPARDVAMMSENRVVETPALTPALVAEPPKKETVTIGDAVTVSKTLFEVFLQEAATHIATLQQDYAVDEPVRHSVVRAAHTLAGIARTVGITAMADLSYALEKLLQVRHDAVVRLNDIEIDLVRQTIRHIGAMVESVRAQQLPEPAAVQIAALVAARELETTASVVAINTIPAKPAASHNSIGSEDLAAVDPELRTTFSEEAYELATSLARSTQAWRSEPTNSSHAEEVARHLHTLKGSARSAGAMSIGETVHEMESRVLTAVNDNKVDTALLDNLQSVFDQWCEAFETARHVTNPAIQARDVAIAVESAAEERADEAKAGAATQLRVQVQTLERMLDGAAEFALSRMRIDSELTAARHTANDLNERVIALRGQLREIEIQAESQMRARFDGVDKSDAQFDPLEFDRYTRLQELTRLMAESLHDLTTVQYNLARHFDSAGVVLSHQGRVQRSLHEDLMHIRTTAFNTVSERLQRIARRTATELQRQVELTVEGGHVELDRTVLEKLQAPLEHMVRNSIAHGIESVSDRINAGKSASGTMKIHVRQEANATVIVISDDGAGLNLTKIRQRARQIGLIGADDAPDVNTASAHLPRLLAADRVTEVAGRGVGLDIVHNTVTSLGGHIRVDSQPGKGTRALL
ncbi:MAG: Hpt domain-containing protein [Gammaproteobacteria bacterium]